MTPYEAGPAVEVTGVDAPTIAVLCQNDFPFAVFEDEDEAFAEKQKRNDPAHGIYFHVRVVPFNVRPSPRKESKQ